MATHAIPEFWTALRAARKQKQRCAEDVQEIKNACQLNHDVPHVAQCRECYDKVIDRMFSRYKDNTDQEWFAGRRSVASSLEMIFTAAKERKATLKDIEDNIGSEKEAWYRSVLRKHPEFLVQAESDAYRDEIRAAVDDPDRSREELVAMVSQAVEAKPDPDRVEKFIDGVQSAEDASALKAFYVSELFKISGTEDAYPHAKPYMDMYAEDDSLSLEDVIDKIIAATQEDRSIQAQRETHRKRLDEVRRAKTAFEQSRAQAKSRAQGAQGRQVKEEYYSPQCAVCGGGPQHGEILSCGVCQTFFEMGSDMQPTMYCSENCQDKGEDDHAEQAHGCQAEHCIWEDDEDEEMEDDSAGFWACNECLDQKQGTLFCSVRCAEKNLPAHRKSYHGLDTAAAEIRDLMSSLDSIVDQFLTGEGTGLKFIKEIP